jgi:hypothetical protein
MKWTTGDVAKLSRVSDVRFSSPIYPSETILTDLRVNKNIRLVPLPAKGEGHYAHQQWQVYARWVSD